MGSRRNDGFPDNGFESWGGYMNAKIAKLEEQYTARAGGEGDKLSDIFNGISIYVNGYTNPSSDELKTLMTQHGGVYHTYQRTTDYIIATNLPDTKVKRLTTTKIVKPEWITESIAATRLLDYKEFLLYSRHTRTQPKLNFNKINSNNNDSCLTGQNDIQTFNTNHSAINEIDMKCHGVAEDSAIAPSSQSPDICSPIIACENVSMTNTAADRCNTEQLLKSEKSPIKGSDITARTAVDPKFLSEFYSNSRLHHISQLGASFKQYVNDLREASLFLFPARDKLQDAVNLIAKDSVLSVKDFGGKIIMHIDMDCFFVSVGLRNRPELRGKAVAVTHAKGGQPKSKREGVDRKAEFNLYRQKKATNLSKMSGVSEKILLHENGMQTRVDGITDEDDKYGSLSEIASCSYEARAKGVRNGMFMGAALRLCPDLNTIPYDFDGYKEVAYILYDIVAQYTLDIEAVSCDEMYVDCTDLISFLGCSTQQFATALRREVRSKTGCPCSTGFGGNRLQARLATKLAKPDGQYFLVSKEVDNFMMDIKLCDLPGVGNQTAQRLQALGHESCGSLRSLSLSALQKQLGQKTGSHLYQQCRGQDDRPLSFCTIRKSVSAEVNYGIRFENYDQCETFLRQLCGEVHGRMRQSKVLGKSITLKLMVRAENAPIETAKFMGHGFCDTINKTATLTAPTDDLEVITRKVLDLCKKQNVSAKNMRGIGIQMSKLETSVKKQQSNVLNQFVLQAEKNNLLKQEVKSKLVTATATSSKCPGEVAARQTENVSLSPFKKNAQEKVLVMANSSTKSETEQLLKIKKVDQMLSPIKRSPIKTEKSSPKKKSLGLTGRRRGRPPKGSVATNIKHLAASRVVMDKFLTGENATTNFNSAHMEAIDQDILAALPEDIRQEVLEHYQMLGRKKDTASSSNTPLKHDATAETAKQQEPSVPVNIKIASISSTKQDIPSASILKTNSSTEAEKFDIFLLPWREVREMLRAWLVSTPAPLLCDVELMSTYMQSMVMRRNIDKLLVLLNFLKRKIQDMNNTEWLFVYDHIIDGIQGTMVAIYGKKLLIN